MTNLFIVESPFQLLSAIEAAGYFGARENVIIIKYSSSLSHSSSNEQLRVLKSEINFHDCYEIQPSISTKITSLKLLLLNSKIKKRYHSIDNVFIGEYRSWAQREFINNLNPGKCYVLDDGNAIIALQDDYIPSGKYYYFGNSRLSRLLDQAQHVIITNLLFPFHQKKKIEWNLFTCFDLYPYSSKQEIIKHSFEFLKKRIAKKPTLQGVVYFFGGNLSELDIISQENEIMLINKINSYFGILNLKLKYIPHRRESTSKLDLIKNKLNIEIVHFSLPAEIEFVKMDYIPQFIASFFSTALFTVSRFTTFKRIYSFKFNSQIINIRHTEDINSTYKIYGTDPHISVIELDD